VRHRLPLFGQYQDAMRGGEWLLFHSATSGPLNLHMLTPREVVDAVLHNPAHAPLNAVEGFIRQVIGWREFVRGMYWRLMPDYARKNSQHATLPMPRFDWVSLPNTLGMSQHGDGGIIGTKPYVASGNYIDRMSDHCRLCRYNPKLAVGEDACPFTTLYWDYLDRHRETFSANFRMRQQYMNLGRKSPEELAAIRAQAAEVKARVTAETFPT
jgi:deoxyribodipyrimidine photolyase-related protein